MTKFELSGHVMPSLKAPHLEGGIVLQHVLGTHVPAAEPDQG